MNRLLASLALLLTALAAVGLFSAGGRPLTPPEGGGSPAGRPARLDPDYSGVWLPRNIAPLNFTVREAGTAYFVRARATSGLTIEVASKTPEIVLPRQSWRRTLQGMRDTDGGLRFEISVRGADGQWRRFEPFTATVTEPVDRYLTYRVIGPVYNYFYDIRIHQRDLEGHGTREVLSGDHLARGCLNCHTFDAGNPERMTIGVRSDPYGNSALLASGGKVTKIGATWGYNAWHPSGQAVAYSLNKVRQFFHDAGEEVRDVVDLDSDLMVYQADTGAVQTAPALAHPDRLETYPTWSPDGKYLYFCSAPITWTDRETVPPVGYEKVRYSLVRVPYDPAHRQFGTLETVLSASDTGLSILLPRISPDGRWLLFCMCRYGCFPVFQPSSDLYLMDLRTREYRKLPINSERSESWHSWSSNSRWIAFSSKRRDGVFTQTCLSYVDAAGRAHKPLVVPVEEPERIGTTLKTHSVPELSSSPVTVSARALGRAARSERAVKLELPEVSMTRKSRSGPAPSEPWQGAQKR